MSPRKPHRTWESVTLSPEFIATESVVKVLDFFGQVAEIFLAGGW